MAKLPITFLNVGNEAIAKFMELADIRNPRNLRILPPECVIGGVMIENADQRHVVKPFILNPLYDKVLTFEKLTRILSPKIYVRGGHQ